MTYALIEDNIVANLIRLHPMNASDFPGAVAVGDVPVYIGDAYEDGAFYRNGERVKSVSELMAEEMADMKSALNELGVNVDE